MEGLGLHLVPASTAIRTIATFALRNAVFDRTFVWLAVMFMAMVLVSAYLGWSATSTIHAIYNQAVVILEAEGRPVPPNPAHDQSPLALLRNMTTYVSLLGALVTIVLGHQMIVEDRRSGVFPLVAARPLSRMSIAMGKIAALSLALLGLLAISLAVNGVMLIILPNPWPSPADWLGLLAFYGVSALYLLLFGLLAMTSAVLLRSESFSLLVPITIWLALMFVLPQVAANINPMAAMNPIKAMVPPPEGAFFGVVGPILAPISFTSTYRDLAATILGFTPADSAALGVTLGVISLVVADAVLVLAAIVSVRRLDPTRSETDE